MTTQNLSKTQSTEKKYNCILEAQLIQAIVCATVRLNDSRGIKICGQTGAALIAHVVCQSSKFALELPILFPLCQFLVDQIQDESLCLDASHLNVAVRITVQ